MLLDATSYKCLLNSVFQHGLLSLYFFIRNFLFYITCEASRGTMSVISLSSKKERKLRTGQQKKVSCKSS